MYAFILALDLGLNLFLLTQHSLKQHHKTKWKCVWFRETEAPVNVDTTQDWVGGSRLILTATRL